MTTLDLLTKPKLRQAAWDYFNDVQTKDQKYVPMLSAEDKPALEINSDIMAEYAPKLREYYYDPLRYPTRSEEHTSELQSLMRISYAVFCLKKKRHTRTR